MSQISLDFDTIKEGLKSIESSIEKKNGVEIEKPFQFFDQDAVMVPEYTLRRANIQGSRFYFIEDDNGHKETYRSVTTIIDAGNPTPFELKKWMVDQFTKYEEYQNYMKVLADRGTLMHMLFNYILVMKEFSYEDSYIEQFIKDSEMNLPDVVKGQKITSFIKNCAYSFSLFIEEYKIKPIMIEPCLMSKRGFAGAIDLVAYSGKLDKHIVIDYKSSDGVYNSHAIQQRAYKDLMTENYPDLEISGYYLFMPQKNFKPTTKTMYTLKPLEKHEYFKDYDNGESHFDALLKRSIQHDKNINDIKKVVFGGEYKVGANPINVMKTINPLELL